MSMPVYLMNEYETRCCTIHRITAELYLIGCVVVSCVSVSELHIFCVFSHLQTAREYRIAMFFIPYFLSLSDLRQS